MNENLTYEVDFLVRQCGLCGHKAVVIDGPGTPCADCENGSYMEERGTKTVEIDGSRIQLIEKHHGHLIVRERLKEADIEDMRR